MNSLLPQQAFEYAKAAHESINQKRKYSGEPYIVHPMRVVAILKHAGVNDPEILAAAYLHDVLEDVYPQNKVYRPEMIEELFGTRVLNLVKDLTDQYTTVAYPGLNRARRKDMEAARLSKIGADAMKIKLADFIDNTSDIVRHDPNYSKVYLREKARILARMEATIRQHFDAAMKNLYNTAHNQINSYVHPR